MTTGKPAKPVEISDSVKELARAILDDRMEPFKAEIEEKLASFAGHKERLLRRLRDAYDLNPKAEPLDEAKSWFGIETTAYQYFALQILKQTVMDHEARYRAISSAAQRAKETMEKARWADHGGNLLKAWLEGNMEFAEATEQYSDLLDGGVEFGRIFDKAAESLTELELAANQLADEFRKERGRPKGTGALPWNYICALAWDYRKSTGKRPGAGDGPFARFVREFLAAIGQGDKSKHYVFDVIKDARTHAREHPSKSTPSPFND